MVGEMLSQEEINALLGGLDLGSSGNGGTHDLLTPEEVDALGEIGNISMGTAATTLFALLNHKVAITTPNVEVLTIDEFKEQITDRHIAVSVGYTEGLTGMNVLILGETDVKAIADLMMGGEGTVTDEPISELHLSAIAEAMNQMIGSSSTSLSQLFNKKIDIAPPQAVQLTDAKQYLETVLGVGAGIVRISFRMEIQENIIDSQLMQVLPIGFAKELVGHLFRNQYTPIHEQEHEPVQIQAESIVDETLQIPLVREQRQVVKEQNDDQHQPIGSYTQERENVMYEKQPIQTMRNIEVQTPQFQQFEPTATAYPKENMNMLLDVALEVSVELGRTKKKIKEILEFGPGSIIELDKLVGEPIDILVNGKFIAKGEVVVIDENFGVRITDIINPENRI